MKKSVLSVSPFRAFSGVRRHAQAAFAFTCASLLALPATLQAQAPQYTATIITTEGASMSMGYDINDRGEVVGSMGFGVGASQRQEAFLYSGGTVSLLGTLGGGNSMAYGINNLGQVVGQAQESDKAYTAFLYSGGQMLNLGRPRYKLGTADEEAVKSSKAVAINDAGQILIESRSSAYNRPAGFVYHSGEATPRLEAIPFLDLPGYLDTGNITVGDINNHGTTIGAGSFWGPDSSSSSGQSLRSRLFVYSNGSHQHQIKSLPEYGYEHVYSLRFLEAKAINDHGTVLGHSTSNNVVRSFIFNPEESQYPTELGTLRAPGEDDWWYSAAAEDINNFGQVVGSSDVDNYGGESAHAFLYEDGTMRDLNSLVVGAEDVTFTGAYAINNWGQIVAQGKGSGGAEFTYLLSPSSFLTFVSEDGNMLNIKAIAGMAYSAYEAPSTPQGSFAAAIIGGTAGGQRDIFLTYTGENVPGGLGEIIDLHGTEDDLFVLELSYDPALVALHDPTTLFLAWFDPDDGTWKNAVVGNSSGDATFVLGAFDSEEHLHLGYYGVDTETNTVWAVLDHNSQFGVMIPEPSTWASLALGAIGIAICCGRFRFTRFTC